MHHQNKVRWGGKTETERKPLTGGVVQNKILAHAEAIRPKGAPADRFGQRVAPHTETA